VLAMVARERSRRSSVPFHVVDAERFDEHLPRPSSYGMLTALDPRNRCGRRADLSCQLRLRQAKLAPTFDDESGKRIVGRESFVLGSKLRVLEGLLNVVGHGRPDGADSRAHRLDVTASTASPTGAGSPRRTRRGAGPGAGIA